MSKRKKLVIEWPKATFTIEDIQASHPDAKNITLRYRINRAKEDGVICEIGKNDRPQGRPTIVFTQLPIKTKVLEKASAKGIVLYEEFNKQLVDVVKVDSTESTVVKTETLAVTA